MSIATHEFGGESTDLKLSVVEGYLQAFTTALRPSFRELLYIDAFAGTGERTARHEAKIGDLLDPATPERIDRHRGSARIAIDINPPFDRLIFIEKNQRHCDALALLKQDNPERCIEIRNGTADEELRLLLDRQSNWRHTRAVLFLDPYGMAVDWHTLEAISRTQAIDVWYLVSLSGLFRQAAIEWRAVDVMKRAAITRMLGTSAWEDAWYTRNEARLDLFGTIDEQSQRTADTRTIQDFMKARLETIFAKVLPPLPLHDARGVQIFSLFFAISNPEPKAIGLATRIANHMLKLGRSSHVRPR